MHVIISAHFCRFEKTSIPGVTMMSTTLFKDDISRETVLVQNAAQIVARMEEVKAAILAAHPDRSFYVSQIRHPRDPDRAFAGYKKLRHRIEYNAEEVALADA